MLGKVKWVTLAVLVMCLSSGCRMCERWYERNHEPPNSGRPYYGPAPAANCCPPGCAPVAPACPPGCAPVAGGYGTGFTPVYGNGCN